MIDMWAPILPVPEVMRHVSEHFPRQMAGYLRVFFKQEPQPGGVPEGGRRLSGCRRRT